MYQSYISKLDNKFRFYLPANIRKYVSTTKFYLTFMNKDNLILCPYDNWSSKKLVGMFDNSLSSEELERLEYFIRISSTLVSLDKDGRIPIPVSFRERLDFLDRVVVSMQDGYISIISKSYVDELSESVNSMINERKLNLTPML